jgi:hypothetical protein
MNPFLPIFDALAFRTEGLTNLKRSPLVFWRGVLALLLIGLVVGFFRAGADEIVRASRSAQTANQVISQIDTGFANVPFGGVPREFVLASIREGVLMGFEIEALTPRGGSSTRLLNAVLTFLGHWARMPFEGGWLPSLLLLGMFTQVAALALGGRGSLAEMLGLGALALAPALLSIVAIMLTTIDTLTNLPGANGIGTLIGLLVLGWQAAVYTKAISVTHDVTILRALAILAVALALMVAVGIALLFVGIIYIGSLVAMVR